ncbi:hypothetical protein [Bizionia sp.]|uniref:hypothetical protein n=1 Tax=Bizionia sp. TaxID=1954480 RepID=UPI003A956948
MRTLYQIRNAEKAYFKLCAKKRKKVDEAVKNEFHKSVHKRMTPEQIIIKVQGGG